MELLISEAVGQGADPLEIYEWTWGEAVMFVQARKDAWRRRMQDLACIEFKTASVIARMFNGKRGEKFRVMKEYEFLFTDEERKQTKVNEIINQFEAANKRIRAREKAKKKLEESGTT